MYLGFLYMGLQMDGNAEVSPWRRDEKGGSIKPFKRSSSSVHKRYVERTVSKSIN